MADTRRTPLEIVADILRLCETPTKKTRIVYQCNLNFHFVNRYLVPLLVKEYLTLKNRYYQTTALGYQHLDIIEPAIKVMVF